MTAEQYRAAHLAVTAAGLLLVVAVYAAGTWYSQRKLDAAFERIISRRRPARQAPPPQLAAPEGETAHVR